MPTQRMQPAFFLFKKGGGSLAEKFTRAAVIFFHSTLHQHAAAGFKSFAARLSAKRLRALAGFLLN
jgi:hypothetical protein